MKSFKTLTAIIAIAALFTACIACDNGKTADGGESLSGTSISAPERPSETGSSAPETSQSLQSASEDTSGSLQSADQETSQSGAEPSENGYSVGDAVQMGEWSGEGLTFTIVGETNDSYLAVCDVIVDCMAFGKSEDYAASDIREFLNGEFFHTAFTADERSEILSVTVESEDNFVCRVPSGEDTVDRVFLLSATEVRDYSVGRAKAIPGAIEKGLRNEDGFANCWLRTPGSHAKKAAVLSYTGALNMAGLDCEIALGGVRPAIRLKKTRVTLLRK